MNAEKIKDLLNLLARKINILLNIVSGSGERKVIPRITEQEALLEILQAYKKLSNFIQSDDLHYKTRLKLQRLLEQSQNLVEGWEILAHNKIPEEYDLQMLSAVIVSMTDEFVLHTLSPVVQYYESVALRDQRFQNQVYVLDNQINAKQLANVHLKNLTDIDEMISLESEKSLPSIMKVGAMDVLVFYGTTRMLNSDAEVEPQHRYLNDRGTGALSLGRALVSIPPGHKIGNIEQPMGIWKIRLKENPTKHIMIKSVTQMNTEDWTESSRAELEKTETQTAFVFIHGFNVTFGKAMLRAAQIARDVDYAGLVTAFSWGSQGNILGYITDEDAVRLAEPALRDFLHKLHHDVGVNEFHIVAHSMGSRALLAVLSETNWWRSAESPIDQVVFAAPDVDAQIYAQTMSTIRKSAKRYTLYVSQSDWALAASRFVRKAYPRAGEGGRNILLLQGVETIDATAVGKEILGLGHSYIADKRSVLGDLWSVLRGVPMTRFGLEEREHKHGVYWVFRS